MGHITHFFGEADLRCQHHGLSEMARKEKIDVGKLQPGEYVVFLNHARDRVKVFTTSNIIAYLKLEKGKIDLRTIQYIPLAFEGNGKIDYNKALKEMIEQTLTKQKKTGPLEAAAEIDKVNKMRPEELKTESKSEAKTESKTKEKPKEKPLAKKRSLKKSSSTVDFSSLSEDLVRDMKASKISDAIKEEHDRQESMDFVKTPKHILRKTGER